MEQSTEEPLSSPPTDDGGFSVEEDYNVKCFCITYLREVLGVNVRGDAGTIQPNVFQGEVGDVMLLTYENGEHGSLIVAKMKQAYLVQESNYHTCKESQRVILFDDPNIRGYYRPE